MAERFGSTMHPTLALKVLAERMVPTSVPPTKIRQPRRLASLGCVTAAMPFGKARCPSVRRSILGAMDSGSWLDAWLDETMELIVGCVLLVVSGWWWFDSRGAIWDGWRNVLATLTVVLGPWFVSRAWKRRSERSRPENG